MRKKKTPKKGPTLQEFELVEVTDPGEFAEFERRVRKAEKEMAERSSDWEKPAPRKEGDAGPERARKTSM